MCNDIEVHRIPAGFSNVYLIQSGSNWVLVDTGMPVHERHILRRISTLGCDNLNLIFLTHAHLDHFGSAAALRQATGAPIAIHHLDAKCLRLGKTELGTVRGFRVLNQALLPLADRLMQPRGVMADIFINDGDDLSEFGLNAYVLHTPGHTLGSSSLIVEDRLAFVGDLASTNFGPHVQRYYAQDWSLVKESYRRVQSLGLEMIYGGHGWKCINGDEFANLPIHHL